MTDINENDSCADNVTNFPNKKEIKEMAGLWLVRIDRGDLSADEINQFQEWLNQSDLHRQYIEKLARNWDSMAILQNLAELFPLSDREPLSHEPARGVEPTQITSIGSRLSSYLSSPVLVVPSLIACALLVVLIFSQQQISHQEFITDVGETSDLQLSDGSRVILNTNSHIKVDYSGDLRIVRLLKGEANFAVAKIPSRPFAVYAGTGMVWAVGTSFNVRYFSDLVDVTVTEGTVKVYTQVSPDKPLPRLTTAVKKEAGGIVDNEAMVIAGESLQYNKIIRMHELSAPELLQRKFAWQQGAIIFKGETLEKVLTEISRYTIKELVIVDPAIKDIRIGGHFKTDDIDGLLETLSRGFGIDVKQVTENRIHLSQNKNIL